MSDATKEENAEPDEPEQTLKKARKPIPKLEASTLTDERRGLKPLYNKLLSLDDNSLSGDKESLALLMRIYQQWLYGVFPGDFGDMCWKLPERKGVKGIVRDFVYDIKGLERLRNVEMGASDDEADRNLPRAEEFDAGVEHSPAQTEAPKTQPRDDNPELELESE